MGASKASNFFADPVNRERFSPQKNDLTQPQLLNKGATMKLKILYEDNHLIAVEKPPGILSQGDYSGEASMIEVVKEYIKEKYQKPGNVFLGLVHRIDRPVSGAMVFARTSKAATRLHQSFLKDEVAKAYLAIVPWHGSLTEEWQLAEHFLQKARGKSEVFEKDGKTRKRAALRFRLLHREESMALVAVHLLTGRKHQIRAQLAYLGHPIWGDDLYGSLVHSPEGIMLHSCLLSIPHPTQKEELLFQAPIPERFASVMEIAREDEKNFIDIIENEISAYKK